MLLAGAAGLIALFFVASRINPYDASGAPLHMATHTQLGLPECNFVRFFGRPCPTCGMTTSFALLVRGDVLASLRANPGGTLFAGGLLLFLPWSLSAALRGRWWWRRAVEPFVVWGLIATVTFAIVRWVVVVGVPWISGRG